MKRVFLAVVVCIAACTALFAQETEEKGFLEALLGSLQQERPIQNVVIPKIPKEASFAGERVPLEYFDVRESLQREMLIINYWHGSLSYIVQLSGRYKDLICNILKEEGVPEDFFYLCVAESSLQPQTSPAGAKGYWQFLAATAREYGLEVGSEVDERYNWEKATRAACKYFRKGYEKYGTWTLAAASYNVGMANINSRIGYQSLDNYYDMQLPLETARYVYRAIAFKTIMNNLPEYGFNISPEDMYRPIECKEVEVKGPVANWSEFARQHNTNFKMIKMCNEWIRSNKLTNKLGKTYKVLVPVSRKVQGE